MKKKLIISLLILEALFIHLAYNSLKNKPVVLDDVKLKEIKVDKNTFGIYVEKSSYVSESDKYQVYNGDTWPSDMVLNTTKSGCMDVNGELVDNALDFANGEVVVTAGQTVYCYLYFDYSKALADVLSRNALAFEYKGEGWVGEEDPSDRFFTNHIYYYYASNQTNANAIKSSWNVVYAGSCWQMIRTTENGGVKLLYNGEPETEIVNGVTQYDCSDNRNYYHMGGIESEYNISGSKVYADSYTATTSGSTTTFTLVNNDESTPTATTIDSSNASSVVGKYTCGNTSTTCTNANLRKIVSIKAGTTANVLISTGRDNIGLGKYNNISTSPAYVGYMYNDTSFYSGKNFLEQEDVIDVLLYGVSSLDLYYYSDGYLTGTSAYANCGSTSNIEGNNTCYTLDNPILGSTIIDPTNSGTPDYSKLVGKYTFLSNSQTHGTSTRVANILYVIAYSGTTLYAISLTNNHPLSYYQKTYNLSQVYENGSLQNSVQVKNFVTPTELQTDSTSWQNTYYFVYNLYNNQNYYACSNGTDACVPWYITSTNSNGFRYYDSAKTYNFSNVINYNSTTSKYTIDMTDSNATTIWNLSTTSEKNKIGKAHYVCLDDTNYHYPVTNTTECEWIGYGYYSNDIVYAVILSGGKFVSSDKSSTSGFTKWADDNNLLYTMLYKDNVNTVDSTIKGKIDKWYEANLLNTMEEDAIDTEEIYCVDRSTKNDFGGWNLSATNMTNSLEFMGLGSRSVSGLGTVYNLSCPNKIDAFSKDSTVKGNGELMYSIGLVSYPEMYNLGSDYLKRTTNVYWLGTPHSSLSNLANLWYINSNGQTGNVSVNNNYVYVRPSIALTSDAEYSRGNGTMTNPYVVEVQSS